MALRRLPFELQTILSRSLTGRGFSTTSHTISWQYRYRHVLPVMRNLSSIAYTSTLSSPTPHDELHSGTIPATVFEEPTSEYDSIPDSTLDAPKATPRTSDEALIDLFHKGDLKGAEALRLDLIQSKQSIPKNFVFAFVAKRRLNEGHADWIEWWKLVPSLTETARLVDYDLSRFRARIGTMSRHAKRILDTLLATHPNNWSTLEAFGLLLAEQGMARDFGDRALVEAAAFLPFETSENLWNAVIGGLNEMNSHIPSYTVSKLSADAQQNRQVDIRFRLKQGDRQPVYSKIAAHIYDDYASLTKRRALMLRTHCSLGRFDCVTAILDQMAETTDLDGGPMHIYRPDFVPLLSQIAQVNKYDHFEKVFNHLERMGARLVPVTSERVRQRTPYFVRSADGPTRNLDYISPQEAFSTFRYSTHVGALEEGTDYAQSALQGELVSAIAMHDEPVAARIVSKLLESHDYPPMHVMANFLKLIHESEQTFAAPFLEILEDHFQPQSSQPSKRAKAFWAESKMLASIGRSDHVYALKLFCECFSLEGMPPAFHRVFASIREELNLAPINRRPLLRIRARAFRLACEALVSYLNNKKAESTIHQLYESLLNNPTIVIPRSPTDLSSPLDSATFTPFILHFREKNDPIILLRILEQMWVKLRLRPTKHQIGMVLGSFARNAKAPDFFYVLDTITRNGSEEALTDSEDLTAIMAVVNEALDGEERSLGIEAWTTMLVGLTLAQEIEAAKLVVQRMHQDQGYGSSWEPDMQLSEALSALASIDHKS